jgi:hypothetical protein
VAGEAHGVGHHEKEAGESQLRDERELVLDLMRLLVRELRSPSHVRALVGQTAQGMIVVLARHARAELGLSKVGKRWTHPIEPEAGAFLGNPHALAQSFLAPEPPFRHGVR